MHKSLCLHMGVKISTLFYILNICLEEELLCRLNKHCCLLLYKINYSTEHLRENCYKTNFVDECIMIFN